MKELFTNNNVMTERHQKGFSAIISIILHAVAIASLFFLRSSVFMTAATAPEHLSLVHLVQVPPKSILVANRQVRAHALVPAKALHGPGPSPNMARFGTVVTGVFDHLAVARLPIGYRGSGEVLVGGFEQSNAARGPLAPFGTVGLTSAFDQFGKQRLESAQYAGDGVARLLWAPAPSYTEEAKRLGVSGEVILEVKMTTSGEVKVLRVLSSLGHGLDEAAIQAVNRSRCRPAVKAGHPADVTATIRVIFKLA